MIGAAARGAAGGVVILSANPIHDTGGGQRSAQLALELLDRGFVVVFVSHGRVTETVDLGLAYDQPRLVQLPLEAFEDPTLLETLAPLWDLDDVMLITQVPVRQWLPVLDAAGRRGAISIYDCIDRWDSELGGGWYNAATERDVAARSDVLVASAPTLVEHVERLAGRETLHLPNAYNARIFDGDRHGRGRPEDLPNAERVALYVGALWGGWMDWKLVEDAARAHATTSFVFIGDHRDEGRGLPSNCAFLGLKAQAALPEYLAAADVAFLPWHTDEITHATSPLKVYEFVAMGLPVVAPAIEPLAGIPGLTPCADRAGFVSALGATGRASLGEDVRAAMRRFSAASSWGARVDRMLQAVDEARTRRDDRATGEGNAEPDAPVARVSRPGAPAVHLGATISVVMPSYNHERYVGAAVDGIRAQTLPAAELVIVDDGSTDGSRDVIEEHRFPGLRAIHQQNRGAPRALNRAITLSRGDYVAILNSDDVFEPHRLEQAWGVARATKAALVLGSVRLIGDQGGAAPPEHDIVRWYDDARAHLRRVGSLRRALGRDNVAVTTSNFFMHRELWRRLGGFRDYRYVHDYEFLLRAVELCAERVHYVDELSGVLYRVHGANTISENTDRAWDERQAMIHGLRRPIARLGRLASRRRSARAVGAAVDATDTLAPAPAPSNGDGPDPWRVGRKGTMRVGIVVESLGTGGLEEVVALLAQTFPALGLPVSVLCTGAGGALADRLRRAGVPVHVAAGQAEAWQEWMRVERIDVVSSHFTSSRVVSALAEVGPPIVETVHNMYAWYGDDEWAAEREKLRSLHSTVAVSPLVADYYRAHTGHAPFAVVPNAVHPGRAAAVPRTFARREIGIDDGVPLFVSVGRITSQKNPDGLLAAFARTVEAVPDARLLLVGPTGADLPFAELESRHRLLFRGGSVSHAGTVADVGVVLSAADAFVSNSFYEGWSVAASEASWIGRPVILSETGGSIELAGSGSQRGRVVSNPCGDPLSVDRAAIAQPPASAMEGNQAALAEAMISVALDRELWRGRAEEIRSHARATLSPRVMGERYASALKNALGV